MKTLFAVLILVGVSLATVVPVSQSKVVFYQIPVMTAQVDLVSEIHIRQNGIYWGVSRYLGELVAVGTNASRRAQWSSATFHDGNPGSEMRELANPNNRIRFFTIGTDSVGLIIADADSTYLYKRLATTSTAPEVWRKSTWAGAFDVNEYIVYSAGTLSHVYPNSMGWSVVAGELVKAESTLTFPTITLYGRPEADFKGNLWTYGYKESYGVPVESVLVKFERITGRGIYYSLNRGHTKLFERDLSTNFTTGLIGRNMRIDSVYLATSPYITPRSIEVSIVAPQSAISFRAYYPVTIVDDFAPLRSMPIFDFWNYQFYMFTDSLGFTTNVNYAQLRIENYVDYTRFPEWTSSCRRKYAHQHFGVWNGHLDSATTMSDTIHVIWQTMSDFMKVTSASDTSVYDTNFYYKRFTVTNSMWLRIKSMTKPQWLTLTDEGQDTSQIGQPAPADSADQYKKSLHFFSLSGIPGTAVGEHSISITFIDSMISLKKDEYIPYYQTCSLSYKITVINTGTAVQTTVARAPVSKKVSNVEVFDLLGRKMTKAAVPAMATTIEVNAISARMRIR